MQQPDAPKTFLEQIFAQVPQLLGPLICQVEAEKERLTQEHQQGEMEAQVLAGVSAA